MSGRHARGKGNAYAIQCKMNSRQAPDDTHTHTHTHTHTPLRYSAVLTFLNRRVAGATLASARRRGHNNR